MWNCGKNCSAYCILVPGGYIIRVAAVMDLFSRHRLKGQPHDLPLGCYRAARGGALLQRRAVDVIRGIRLQKSACRIQISFFLIRIRL